MKRWTARLLAAGLALTLAACGSTPATGGTGQTAPATASLSEGLPSGDRILIAYFSVPETDGVDTVSGASRVVVDGTVLGNNQYLAQLLQGETGGDLFPLEPADPYTDEDLNWTDESSRVVQEHDNPEARDVALVADTVDNWEAYDTVFLGYPIWWGIAAWPVDTFVAANDFTGKTVIPFCTSSSSGLGESGQLLADLAGTGDWQEGQRFSSSVDQAEVQDWLEGLSL